MSDAAAVLLMVLVGAQLAPQAALNRELAGRTSGLAATFVSFSVGLLLVVAVCAASGQLGEVGGAFDVPPGHLAGGLLGAGFVLIAVLSVGAIGASGVAAAAVTGQLIASLALDATGALHLQQRPLTAPLLLGAAAVLLGTFLVVGGGNAARGLRSHGLRQRLPPTLATIAGGAMLGLQHPLNHELGEAIGDLPSAAVNFALASLALAAVLLLSGQAPRLAGLRRVPPPYLLGGVMGAVNATASLVLVGRIGAGAVAAAGVTGQLTASLALDRAGVLGLRRRGLDWQRLAGAALLVAGTVLVAA